MSFQRKMRNLRGHDRASISTSGLPFVKKPCIQGFLRASISGNARRAKCPKRDERGHFITCQEREEGFKDKNREKIMLKLIVQQANRIPSIFLN